MRALLLLGLLGLTAAAGAQPLAEGGARRIALARGGVALGGDVWGHANAAAWAGLDARAAGLQASQAYGLSELRLAALAVATPTPVGTVALAARTYGFEQHRETRVELGLGRRLPLSRSRSLDAGLALGVESTSTADRGDVTFGSTNTFVLSAGVQGEVLSGFRVGLSGRNLLGVARSADADLSSPLSTVPTVGVGVAYAPSAAATVVLDATQDLDAGLGVGGGVEIRPVEMLTLRVGAGTTPVRYSAGVGVRAAGLVADLAFEKHQDLGVTPAVGLGIVF